MKQKTALITGASRGIGRAIARAFAAEGYHLCISCKHNSALLENVSREIAASFGVTCLTYTGDMGDPAQVEEMFALFQKHFSHLDVLVNNAGISYIGLLTDMTLQQWDQIIQTNLSSVFYTCRQAIPSMVSQKSGKIVNISSIWGLSGASCEAAYSASKGGVNALTKALAKELAPSNIQVNALACGVIDTEMNGFLDEEEKAALLEEIPAGRMGLPEEAAHLVLQLCTENTYLTGQVIALDGGFL